MVGLVSNFPQLVWISRHSVELFIIAGIMLTISGYFVYKKDQSCPINPAQAKACIRLKFFTKIVFWISITFYGIGLFFAYLFKYFIWKNSYQNRQLFVLIATIKKNGAFTISCSSNSSIVSTKYTVDVAIIRPTTIPIKDFWFMQQVD